MARPSAPSASAARARSRSATSARIEIPSPSEIAWLSLRPPAIARDATSPSRADRIPHGLQLEEGGDLPRALAVGGAANDAFDVLGGQLLELGREAVGAGDVEGVHVHVPGEPGGKLGAVAGE